MRLNCPNYYPQKNTFVPIPYQYKGPPSAPQELAVPMYTGLVQQN
jgi:hypothetical protein